MTPEVRDRIEQIRHGNVPEGYVKSDAGIIPASWQCKSIGSSLRIKNNERKPISEEVRQTIPGPYPYYGPTQAQGYISTYESEGPAVLIGEDGDHFLKYKSKPMTLWVDGKYTVNNHAHMICGTEICNARWFYYVYEFKPLLNAITRQGAGRYKLTKDALEKLPIQLPSSVEQKQISEILTTQDKVIELKEKRLAEKQRQKKHLMQQLLTGKKRLPGFSGEWQKIAVGAFIHEVDEKTTENNQYDILSVTKNGIVRQSDHFNKQIASEDNTGYKILRRGNLAFSSMNLWMGSLDVLEDYEIGIISPAYKVFSFNTKLMDIKFGKQFMRSEPMIWQYKVNSEQGASIVRRNLDLKALLSTKVSIPNINEQQAIAAVFVAADKEIELLRQDLEQEKQKKKALMQLLLTGIVRV